MEVALCTRGLCKNESALLSCHLSLFPSLPECSERASARVSCFGVSRACSALCGENIYVPPLLPMRGRIFAKPRVFVDVRVCMCMCE